MTASPNATSGRSSPRIAAAKINTRVAEKWLHRRVKIVREARICAWLKAYVSRAAEVSVSCRRLRGGDGHEPMSAGNRRHLLIECRRQSRNLRAWRVRHRRFGHAARPSIGEEKRYGGARGIALCAQNHRNVMFVHSGNACLFHRIRRRPGAAASL